MKKFKGLVKDLNKRKVEEALMGLQLSGDQRKQLKQNEQRPIEEFVEYLAQVWENKYGKVNDDSFLIWADDMMTKSRLSSVEKQKGMHELKKIINTWM